MGQTVEITDRTSLGDVLLVSADRSFTGQDGEVFSSAPIEPTTFPGQLAVRLFETDEALDHVYVMSNTVSLRRRGGWDDASTDRATDTISRFFRFYPEN